MKENTESRFVVVHISRGDEDREIFTSPEEAASRAEYLWNHLTEREKNGAHIYSAIVRLEDLDPDCFDDDEPESIPWDCFTGCDDYPGCFDSNKI